MTDAEIPAHNLLPHTGAKSKIHHMAEGVPYADIVFYTKEEFLKEIISPYYVKLGILEKLPKTLEEFRKPVPELSIGDDNASGKVMYERLKFIHQNFADFGDLLSKPSQRIDLKQVRNYVVQVAQDEGKMLYLAVKVANIYTRFPNPDITDLCLVDLPGLEAEQGHEEKLAASLEREVDAVVLVKLPSFRGTMWDEYEAISLIAKSLKQVELADWLFVVLNDDGKNKPQIDALRRIPMPLASQPQVLVANCSSAAEVQGKVFSIILEHFRRNLGRIDKRYVQTLIGDLDNIKNHLIEMVQPVQTLLSANSVIHAGDEDLRLFMKLFHQFMTQLNQRLEKLVGELRKTDENRLKFQSAVEALCNEADQSPPVPSVEDLSGSFFTEAGWHKVVQEQFHILRAHLTLHLCKLDVALQEMVNGVFQKVLGRILPDTIINTLISQTNTNQLSRMREFQQLFDQKQHPRLYEAFGYITCFTFSYHSHFHYRVRQEMGPLDPMMDPSIVDEILRKDATDEHAQEIADGLRSKYRQAVFRVRTKLQGEMQTDPSRAIFALVEEVKDRIIRAQDIETEWMSFLNIRRGQIWADQFGKREQFRNLQSRWQIAISDIIDRAAKLRAGFNMSEFD